MPRNYVTVCWVCPQELSLKGLCELAYFQLSRNFRGITRSQSPLIPFDRLTQISTHSTLLFFQSKQTALVGIRPVLVDTGRYWHWPKFAFVAGGISRESAFVLAEKPWTREGIEARVGSSRSLHWNCLFRLGMIWLRSWFSCAYSKWQ